MKRQKRSLSRSGGRCHLSGNLEAARVLERCLTVDPRAEIPFTHGFHAYPARMHPETARRAVEAFPGAVWDPFVGSGTTALETVRAGRPFVGGDISRVALEIAWARTRVALPDECRRVEIEGHRFARLAYDARRPSSDPLPAWAHDERDWYPPHTLREICVLKAMIDAHPDAPLRRLLTCVLSSLLVKLSKQKSDSECRIDPDFRPRPPGAAFRLFREKCTELTQNLLRLSSDLYKRKIPFKEPDLRLADAREATLPPGTIDLVLTSPPYVGMYDYAQHHARRFPLYGETTDFAEGHEIGARNAKAGSRYREDLAACLKNILSALKPDGRALLLLGDGIVEGATLRADFLIAEQAPKLGARLVATASQGRAGARREHLMMLAKA